MKFRTLREEACRVNRELPRAGLCTLTWGNASAVDRRAGVLAIKPSGVDYGRLRPEDMVILALDTGRVVDGTRRPSTDAPTHWRLLRSFTGIGGVVHTHSRHATAWAQARRPLPCLGTTHADHFQGAVPVCRALTRAEVAGDYTLNTGLAIVDTFRRRKLDPLRMPAVLMPGHGSFTWGVTLQAALENAVALEAVAQMALDTLAIRPGVRPLAAYLRARHFFRKHGPGAAYGQSG